MTHDMEGGSSPPSSPAHKFPVPIGVSPQVCVFSRQKRWVFVSLKLYVCVCMNNEFLDEIFRQSSAQPLFVFSILQLLFLLIGIQYMKRLATRTEAQPLGLRAQSIIGATRYANRGKASRTQGSTISFVMLCNSFRRQSPLSFQTRNNFLVFV